MTDFIIFVYNFLSLVDDNPLMICGLHFPHFRNPPRLKKICNTTQILDAKQDGGFIVYASFPAHRSKPRTPKSSWMLLAHSYPGRQHSHQQVWNLVSSKYFHYWWYQKHSSICLIVFKIGLGCLM